MRLIDADVLLETGAGIKIIIPKNCHPYEAIRIQGSAFRKAVEESPTIDAVEVVRCKDCRHTKTDGMADPAIYCQKYDIWEIPPDHFCAFGERKDE